MEQLLKLAPPKSVAGNLAAHVHNIQESSESFDILEKTDSEPALLKIQNQKNDQLRAASSSFEFSLLSLFFSSVLGS